MIPVHVASTDTGSKCCRCGAAIRAGQEYAIVPWPNGGGFDHRHVECPAPPDNTGPRVVQQPRNRRNA